MEEDLPADAALTQLDMFEKAIERNIEQTNGPKNGRAHEDNKKGSISNNNRAPGSHHGSTFYNYPREAPEPKGQTPKS